MIEKSKTLPPVPRAHFTSSFSVILGFPSSVSWITDRYANTLGWAGLNLRTFPIRIRYTRAREFVCSACAYIHVRLPVRVAGRHWTYLGFELVRNVGGLVSFLYKWVSPGHRCRAHDLHWFFRSRHLRSHRYSNHFVRERWGEIVYLSDRKSEIDRCRMAGWPSATGCRVKLFSLVPFFPPQFSQDGKYGFRLIRFKCGFCFSFDSSSTYTTMEYLITISEILSNDT